MENDAFCLFHLSDTSFLARMSVAYPQPLGLWKISPPPPELIYCVIYMLRRKPCEWELFRMRDSRGCTSSGLTSVPPCKSILLSNIYACLTLNSSKSPGTGSDMPSTTSAEWNDLGRRRFFGHGGLLQ